MFRSLYLYIFLLFSVFLLSSCSSMTPSAAKRAYCNMLKSDLVFNGSTSVTRTANIENSETPLVRQNYNQADCDES